MPFRQRYRKVGNLVDLEALVGLVDPPLARLQQGVQVHGPRVVVDVVRALPVGEELDALDQAGRMSHDGVEVVGRVVVHEAEGYLDAVGVQKVAACRQRNACHPAAGRREGAETARVELNIFSRYDIGRVASTHFVVQRADQLIVHGVGHLIHHSCLAFPTTALRWVTFVLADHTASGSRAKASRRNSLKDGSGLCGLGLRTGP